MSKLPTPAKLGLLGAAVLVALVVGWFVVIAPKNSEASKLQNQIDDARTQLAVGQAAQTQPQTPAIRLADIFKLSRAMPNRADIPGVMLQLSQIARESGVSFQSITPHDPVQAGSFLQLPIDLVFEGRFYDISDFLFRLRNLVRVRGGNLETKGRLVSVDTLSFSEGERTFPQVKAAMTVSAYVYGDGTTAPIPAAASSAAPAAATAATPARDDSQPIPAQPAGATAAGARP